jgi:hypothetical protein
MACLIRDEVCDAGVSEVLVCDPCLNALTGALAEAPALLRLLSAETGHSLAHPLTDVPNRGTPDPSAPARVHMIDLSARLVDAIAEWSAITGHPPARTLPGMASACARLAAAPYRYLAALGGVASARAALGATRAARRALVPLVGVQRLTKRCPQCRTKGLTRITERGPAVCEYCGHQLL